MPCDVSGFSWEEGGHLIGPLSSSTGSTVQAPEASRLPLIAPLTYDAFPEEHRRRIRTNNPLERILREIRRRTRVVGAFPDGNPRSTSLAPGYATSPAQRGRRRDI